MTVPAAGQATGDPVALTAHAIRQAVLAVPGVARLSAGPLGEVATYLPGGRVTGVRLAGDGVHVHVVLTATAARAIPAVAAEVHVVVAQVAAGAGTGPVHVHIEDVDPVGPLPHGSQVPLTGTGKDIA